MSKQYILNQKMDKFFEENPELRSNDEGSNFLVFALHTISPYELETADTEDLLSGIVEGGGDLGIDAIFVLVNGKVYQEFDVEEINSNTKLKILFIQTKKRRGFDENGFRKSTDSIKKILNLDIEIEEFRELGADDSILKKINLLRQFYGSLAAQGVNDIEFKLLYITQGNTNEVNRAIKKIKRDTEEEINRNIIGKFIIELIGIDELISLLQRKPVTRIIEFIQSPVEIEAPVKSYIGVVNAKHLIEILLDNKNKSLEKSFFEDNVRHFLGLDKAINKTMKETASKEPKNFWYFNNGITMVSDEIESISQKKYRVQNPQVVNGLQTLYSLYELYRNENDKNKLSKVYLTLRLIGTNDTEFKMKVISYTNSQNKIEEPSLKAIDEIHKLIEDYLRHKGIYYERRLNYYKSQGIKGVKVIDLRRMAQILWSVYQKNAIFAYNDPKKIFLDESKYQTIFPTNTNIDYDYYYFASELFIKIWSIKRGDVTNMKKGSEEHKIFSSASALFLILNTISCLIFNDINPIDFHKFSEVKRNNGIFEILEDKEKLINLYNISKEIVIKSINNYKREHPNKNYVKDRKFDENFLIPNIRSYLQNIN